MKKILAFFVLGLFSFSLVWGQGTQEEVPGFRGIKWGTPIDSVYKDGEKVEFVQVKGKNKPEIPDAYVISDDDMTIGTVDLTKILYYFNGEGRFHKVRITGEKEDLKDMNFILRHKFGTPLQVDETSNIRTQEWTVDNVDFTLVNPYESSYFTLVIASHWTEIEAYKKNSSVKDF